jgi:small subunit ribosomal protein S8
VDVPASKLKTEIARILKEEGYIAEFQGGRGRPQEGHQDLPEVRHRQRAGHFEDRARVAAGLPGVCRARQDIPRVQGGLGINILTTPRGVMTGRDAHKEKIGGELLCGVW